MLNFNFFNCCTKICSTIRNKNHLHYSFFLLSIFWIEFIKTKTKNHRLNTWEFLLRFLSSFLYLNKFNYFFFFFFFLIETDIFINKFWTRCFNVCFFQLKQRSYRKKKYKVVAVKEQIIKNSWWFVSTFIHDFYSVFPFRSFGGKVHILIAIHKFALKILGILQLILYLLEIYMNVSSGCKNISKFIFLFVRFVYLVSVNCWLAIKMGFYMPKTCQYLKHIHTQYKINRPRRQQLTVIHLAFIQFYRFDLRKFTAAMFIMDSTE